MNITLKDVPKGLHGRLKKMAEQSGRSLNKMILHTLEQSVQPRQLDRAALLRRITNRRGDMSAWLEDKTLRSAIEEGRR